MGCGYKSLAFGEEGCAAVVLTRTLVRVGAVGGCTGC